MGQSLGYTYEIIVFVVYNIPVPTSLYRFTYHFSNDFVSLIAVIKLFLKHNMVLIGCKTVNLPL